MEVRTAVFQLVLQVATEKGLLIGKTVAVDSTTLEANASMKSIVRRDTGEDWKNYRRLAGVHLAKAESLFVARHESDCPANLK